MLRWVNKAAECCLNDLIFSGVIRLLILHRVCVRINNVVVLKTFSGPIALEKVFLLFSKGSCPLVYDCSWAHMFWSNHVWDRFFFLIDITLVSLGGISKNNSSWHFLIKVFILLSALAIILKENRKNLKIYKSFYSLRSMKPNNLGFPFKPLIQPSPSFKAGSASKLDLVLFKMAC